MKKCSLIFLFIMLLQNINGQYFMCDTLGDFRKVPQFGVVRAYFDE